MRLVGYCLILVIAIIGRETFAATTDPLIQESDLQYVGAFRLPSGTFGQSKFSYGGAALAYNPANNSLFIVGHDWDQKVAEIKIPQVVNSSSITALATATVLQPFADPSEGRMYSVDNGTIKVGGLLVYKGKLYGSAYSYYDANGSQSVSHYSSGLNLSINGDAQGMFRVGDVRTGFVSGYMGHIPQDWQALFGAPAITGNCCIPIISRTSFGPSALAFDPGKLGEESITPAAPMVYYPMSNPLDRCEATSVLFNCTTGIRGVAFPSGTRSVLFFGTQGIGEWCYGTGSTCNDPARSSQGNHAYPYQSQVWAYDANQLLAVKNGQLQPWEVKPYATWKLASPFADNRIGGAAYDPATRLLFLAQPVVDGERPIILVYRIGKAPTGETGVPPAPSNLAVR